MSAAMMIQYTHGWWVASSSELLIYDSLIRTGPTTRFGPTCGRPKKRGRTTLAYLGFALDTFVTRQGRLVALLLLLGWSGRIFRTGAMALAAVSPFGFHSEGGRRAVGNIVGRVQ
jgi:hypothetical protein